MKWAVTRAEKRAGMRADNLTRVWTARPAATMTVLVAAVAVLLTGCLGATSSGPRAEAPKVLHSTLPTPTETVPPTPPPPPPPHACYRLGYAEVLAPTISKKPAPCTGIHTAATFFVGSYRKSLPVTGKAVRALESRVCPRRFAAFVGGTLEDRRLSMLRSVWFTPSPSQAARGAHWFACLAIALQGEQHLALLRGRLGGALDTTARRDHYALCGSAEPGSAGFQQRICAGPHTWRALSTVPLGPGRYPGPQQVSSAGQQPCKDAGRAAAGNPLDYQWSYQWPSLKQWRAGQTYGVCWAPG